MKFVMIYIWKNCHTRHIWNHPWSTDGSNFNIAVVSVTDMMRPLRVT